MSSNLTFPFALRLLALSAMIPLAVACAADDSPATISDDESTTLPQDGAPQVLASWRPAISDESPTPLTCRYGAISKVRCTGKYCDNIAAHCSDDLPVTKVASYWKPAVSDEFDNNYPCGRDESITGFTCRGQHCDNVSFECGRFDRLRRVNPESWNCINMTVSDQFGGLLEFPPMWHPVAMSCEGHHCAALQFMVCPFEFVDG